MNELEQLRSYLGHVCVLLGNNRRRYRDPQMDCCENDSSTIKTLFYLEPKFRKLLTGNEHGEITPEIYFGKDKVL